VRCRINAVFLYYFDSAVHPRRATGSSPEAGSRHTTTVPKGNGKNSPSILGSNGSETITKITILTKITKFILNYIFTYFIFYIFFIFILTIKNRYALDVDKACKSHDFTAEPPREERNAHHAGNLLKSG
jgi:hypothetical protein